MVFHLEGDLFIAVGNGQVRKKLMERETTRIVCEATQRDCEATLMEREDRKNFPVLIHPNAVVADDVEIGCGSVVMAGAVINPGAKIGKGVIVNTSSSIDHDCVLGVYVHVSVGAHLAGTVTVGNNTWI